MALPAIGWVGVGVMGHPMALHLIRAGFPMTLHSRTKSKANDLLNAGARWADSPREVASKSETVFTMVGFPDEVRSVTFGENGVLSGLREKGVLIDMTTTSPALSHEIAAAARKNGQFALDAPVSGGDVGAREASLSILVGGEKEIYDRALPLFEKLGKNIHYQGPSGSGQQAKLANQLVIAGTMVGVCEALVYAEAAGLNLPVLLQSIRKGAAGCWTLENLVPRMLSGNFAPGFLIDHFVKDLGIALEESERMNLRLKGLKLAHELYCESQRQGLGQNGTHALYLAVKKVASRALS